MLTVREGCYGVTLVLEATFNEHCVAFDPVIGTHLSQQIQDSVMLCLSSDTANNRSTSHRDLMGKNMQQLIPSKRLQTSEEVNIASFMQLCSRLTVPPHMDKQADAS